MWIELTLPYFNLLSSIIQDFKFEIHHATSETIVLNKWLVPEQASQLPHFASHSLGAGGLVLHPTDNKILLIKEKFKMPNRGSTVQLAFNNWKLPGGQVEP